VKESGQRYLTTFFFTFLRTPEMGNLTSSEAGKLAMAVGICFAAYKFGQHPAIKGGAIAVAAVIVAKRVPVLSAALA
jgi:hypothetical protein